MLPSDVAMVIAHVALLIVGFWRAGLKTHELLEEGEFHIACRAISIFGNNKFCLALVSIALVVGVGQYDQRRSAQPVQLPQVVLAHWNGIDQHVALSAHPQVTVKVYLTLVIKHRPAAHVFKDDLLHTCSSGNITETNPTGKDYAQTVQYKNPPAQRQGGLL